MTETSPAKTANTGRVLQILIIGLGTAVFLLLFFADKTNLTNRKSSELSTGSSGSATVESPQESAALPPLAPDATLDQLIQNLSGQEGEEKIRLLDTIVVSLQARNRWAYASDYALQMVSINSSLQNQLLVGRMSQLATTLPYIQQNPALLKQYTDRSIQYLQKVLDQEENQEEALLRIGLAKTNLNPPMEGIQTLVKMTQLYPENKEAEYHLGLFSIRTGQWEKARQRFQRVLEIDPQDYEATYQLAFVESQDGNLDQAQALLADLMSDKAVPGELKLRTNELLNQLKNR